MYMMADGDMMMPEEPSGGDIPCPGPFPLNSLQIIHCKGGGQFVFEVMTGAYCCTIQAGTEHHTSLNWQPHGKEIVGQETGDRLGDGEGNGNGVVLSGNGKVVAVSSRYNGDEEFSPNAGQVRVYKETTYGWSQIGQTLEGDTEELFGYSVSLSHDGKTIAVGGIKSDSLDGLKHAGRVAVFDFVDDEFPGFWEQRGDVLEGLNNHDYYGHAVSLCELGTVVAIGAIQSEQNINGHTGYVQVLEWNLNKWRNVGELIWGEDDGDLHGNALSLSSDGRVLAVGAKHRTGQAGSKSGYVRVFRFYLGEWEPVGNEIHGEGERDHFGGSLSLSEDGYTVAVGAEFNDGISGQQSGHARVFRYERDVEEWVQIGQDIDGEGEGHGAGVSVSLSGNTIAVGAIKASADGTHQAGHVKTYEYDVNRDEWVQFGDTIIGDSDFDHMGHSVSLSRDGSRLALSIPNADRTGEDSGAVKVFRLGTDEL